MLAENKQKWDVRFLKISKEISTWSKDPSTQVGSVIVDENRRIISTGYNGLPQGIEDSDAILNNRERKYRHILHAEENAIDFAHTDIAKSTVYVYPLPPCLKCTSRLIQNRVGRIVSIVNHNERWKAETDEAKEIFNSVGIEVTLYESSELDT